MKFIRNNKVTYRPDFKGWFYSVKGDPWCWGPAIFLIAILLLMVLALIYFYLKLPTQIPFYYSKVWGEQRLANRELIWLLPSVSSLVGGINFGFGASIHQSEVLLARFLYWSAALVALLSGLSILNILLLMMA